MNRKQRRASGKTGHEPVINIKAADVQRIKQEAMNEAIDRAFIMMLAFPAMVLRDKWGFGKVRSERFVDQVLELYDSFNKDLLSLEDLHEVLKEEIGLTLTR